MIHDIHKQLDMWRSIEKHCRLAAQSAEKRDITMARYYADTIRTELAYLDRERMEAMIDIARASNGLLEE